MSLTQKSNKMKHILLFFALIFSQNYFAQEYPLDYKGDVPHGAYYKDLNGELNKYVGLWKGIWNGKTIYLELKKVKYKVGESSNYIFRDKILGERKVIASNGNIEVDRITNFDYLYPEILGININLKTPNIKRFYFYPKNMCNKFASLDVMSISSTQMVLHFEYQPSFVDPNCQHNAYVDQTGDFPINFPKDVTLTKQ